MCAIVSSEDQIRAKSILKECFWRSASGISCKRNIICLKLFVHIRPIRWVHVSLGLESLIIVDFRDTCPIFIPNARPILKDWIFELWLRVWKIFWTLGGSLSNSDVAKTGWEREERIVPSLSRPKRVIIICSLEKRGRKNTSLHTSWKLYGTHEKRSYTWVGTVPTTQTWESLIYTLQSVCK